MKISDKLKRFFYVLRCYLADQDPVEKTQLEAKLPKYKTKKVAAAYLGNEIVHIYWSWSTTEEELLEEIEEQIEHLKDPYWSYKGSLQIKIINIKIPYENNNPS